MKWIFTAREENMPLEEVREEIENNETTTWLSSSSVKNVKKGDIVYIYYTLPLKRIVAKAICTREATYLIYLIKMIMTLKCSLFK